MCGTQGAANVNHGHEQGKAHKDYDAKLFVHGDGFFVLGDDANGTNQDDQPTVTYEADPSTVR